MPWQVRFVGGGCIRSLSGRITIADLADSREEIARSPEADGAKWMLDDSRDVRDIFVTEADAALEQMIIGSRLLPRARKWAVVGGGAVESAVAVFDRAPNPPAGKVETRYFQSIAAAMLWLGVKSVIETSTPCFG